MGAGYKDSEKKAFKDAEKWQKSKEKKKITEDKKKGKKDLKIKKTTGGDGLRGAQKFIKFKGKMYRRGTPMAKRAEEAERKRKALGAKGYMKK